MKGLISGLLVLGLAKMGAAVNCTSDSDIAYWESVEGFAKSAEKLELCGKEHLGAKEGTKLCVEDQFPGFSVQCDYCFTEVIACTATRCVPECGSNIFTEDPQPLCVECVETKCNTPFEACAGFPINTCETCASLPTEEEFPVGLVVGGAIGGLLALGLIFCFVKWVTKPPLTPEQKQMILEKRIADLGVKEISTVAAPEGTGVISKQILGTPEPKPSPRESFETFPPSVSMSLDAGIDLETQEGGEEEMPEF